MPANASLYCCVPFNYPLRFYKHLILPAGLAALVSYDYLSLTYVLSKS